MDVIKLFQAKRLPHLAGVATVVVSAFVSAPAPPVSADPCPDVEVVFARGTSEPPGVGMAGRALVDAQERLSRDMTPDRQLVRPLLVVLPADTPEATHG